MSCCFLKWIRREKNIMEVQINKDFNGMVPVSDEEVKMTAKGPPE